METQTVTDLSQILRTFYGSENYHRATLRRDFLHTEGVEFLANEAGAFWLIDAIASHQAAPRVRAEEFQVWNLTLTPTRARPNQALLTCDDGNGNVLARQRIAFTDFPLSTIKLYVEMGSIDGRTPAQILLLPSER